MTTGLAALLDNLLRFYPFDGKVVLAVGAGGGQLAGYGRAAKRVIAVDHEAAAGAYVWSPRVEPAAPTWSSGNRQTGCRATRIGRRR